MKKILKKTACIVAAAAMCISALSYSFAGDSVTDPAKTPAGDSAEEGNSNNEPAGDSAKEEINNNEPAGDSAEDGSSNSQPAEDLADSDGGESHGASVGLQASEIPEPEAFDFSSGEATVLADNEYCTITLVSMGMEENDFFAEYKAGLTIENKTDVPLSFTTSHGSINRKMCEPFWFEIVEPGDIIETAVAVSDLDLERCRITDVIDFQFTISCTEEDKFADNLFVLTVDLFPEGMEAGLPVEGENDSTCVIYDSDVCTITVVDIVEDEMAYHIAVRVDNKSDSNLIILPTEETKINGIESRPFFICSVDKHKSCNTTFSWYALSEIGIDNIESVDLGIDILDADDWCADSFFDGVISVPVL